MFFPDCPELLKINSNFVKAASPSEYSGFMFGGQSGYTTSKPCEHYEKAANRTYSDFFHWSCEEFFYNLSDLQPAELFAIFRFEGFFRLVFSDERIIHYYLGISS